MPGISIKQLLEAGVHFGHQTKRWNPKMKEYIFGERNGIYIIDLQKTLRLFKVALELVVQLAAQGKTILFVGTKRQAQEAIAEEAKRCGMFYVNQRWLGGLLTNFTTIQKSIQRLKELEAMKESGQYNLLSKKEVGRLERERKKLEKNLSGIKEMTQLPDAMFIIDSMKENIAIREARKLNILVIGVVDTNCDPEQVDYIIPGNDDALKSVKLITSAIAEAIIEGRAIAEAAQIEAQAASEKETSQAPPSDVAGTATVKAKERAETPTVRVESAKGTIEVVTAPPSTETIPENKKADPKKRFERKPKGQAEKGKFSARRPSKATVEKKEPEKVFDSEKAADRIPKAAEPQSLHTDEQPKETHSEEETTGSDFVEITEKVEKEPDK